MNGYHPAEGGELLVEFSTPDSHPQNHYIIRIINSRKRNMCEWREISGRLESRECVALLCGFETLSVEWAGYMKSVLDLK